jgi:hypothetical protein
MELLGDGVFIFADPQFRGDSFLMLDGQVFLDLSDMRMTGCRTASSFNFDNCISSIHIPEGRKVTVYEDPYFMGASVTLTSDVRDLANVRGPCDGHLDNCISSIRVSRQ